MKSDLPIITWFEGPIPHSLADSGHEYYNEPVFIYSSQSFYGSRRNENTTSMYTTRLAIFNTPEFIGELDQSFMTAH
jgi:hypothetical protein